MKLSTLALIILANIGMQASEKYPYRIGYIPEEGAINFDADFKPCGDYIIDYYNVNKGGDRAGGYIGGPKMIKRIIAKDYPNLNLKNESGMLTIRFIINCKGEIGRFQIVENDLNFQPKEFDKDVKYQLLEITQNLEDWNFNIINGRHYDSVMYLTFKMKDGEIIDILP